MAHYQIASLFRSLGDDCLLILQQHAPGRFRLELIRQIAGNFWRPQHIAWQDTHQLAEAVLRSLVDMMKNPASQDECQVLLPRVRHLWNNTCRLQPEASQSPVNPVADAVASFNCRKWLCMCHVTPQQHHPRMAHM